MARNNCVHAYLCVSFGLVTCRCLIALILKPFDRKLLRETAVLQDFYGAQVVFHALKSGSVFLGRIPVAFGILAHELHGQKATAN